ncbi:MAG: DUF2381 family protein [Kofleriaceae bacterium]
MRIPAIVAASIAVFALLTPRTAAAQKSCEYLVAPSGGAFEIAVNPAYLTSLQFPGKLASANTSDLKDYEIRKDADTGLLVRPKAEGVKPANINVVAGTTRISVGLRTVPDAKDACALVTFRATTEEEALERRVAEAVAARTAALEAELATVKRDQDARVRAALDGALADRAMARLDMQRLSAVERNEAGVVLWVMRGVFLGADLMVNVEIENRSGVPFVLADLELQLDGKNHATAARLATGTGGALLGTVAPGAKVRGIVVARDGAQLAGKDLALVARTADGAGQISVHRLGIR